MNNMAKDDISKAKGPTQDKSRFPPKVLRKGMLFRKAWGVANTGGIEISVSASKKPFCRWKYTIGYEYTEADRKAERIKQEAEHNGAGDELYECVVIAQPPKTEKLSGDLPSVASALAHLPYGDEVFKIVAMVSELLKDSISLDVF